MEGEALKYTRHALTKTLHAANPLWSEQIASGKLSFDQDKHLFFALQIRWVENNVGALLAREFDDEKRPGANAKAAEIRRAQVSKSTSDAAIAFTITSASDVPFIFERARSDGRVLGALRSERPAGAEKRLMPLFDSNCPELHAAEALKPGEGNTLRLEARGATCTSWLNGRRAPQYTNDNFAAPGSFGLHVHANLKKKVEFRNIRAGGLCHETRVNMKRTFKLITVFLAVHSQPDPRGRLRDGVL